LFLAQFPAVPLLYADIARGVLFGFVGFLYLGVERRTSLGNLLVGIPLFFAANRRELLNLRGLMQITHAPEPPLIRQKKPAPLRRQHGSGA